MLSWNGLFSRGFFFFFSEHPTTAIEVVRMVGGHLRSVGGAAWEQLKTRHNTLKEWNERVSSFFFFTIKENDVLKWEKVHQTLSGLLNRHRFSLIRVNFPAPFFRRTIKKNVLFLFSCRLLIIRERQVVCVCAVPLGRYEIRHGGDAQLKTPFNIHFHLVVFIFGFGFRRTCSSR